MNDPDSKTLSELKAEVARLQLEVTHLQQSETRLREMGNNIALGLYRRTCGALGVILSANPAMARLFGYDDPGQLINVPIRSLYWEPEECDQFSEEVFDHGDVIRQELKMKHKAGSPIWVTVTTTMICDQNDKPEFFDGILEDITARKTAELETTRQQQQLIQADKMATLGILVSGVAHEINNPNQFIVSHVSPLKKIWGDIQPILDRYYEQNGDFQLGGRKYSIRREQVPEMFTNIHKGAQRIKHIVRELRDYAREQPFEMRENLQINTVVDSALELLSNLIGKSTTRFSIEQGKELPLLTGDYQRLEQVVINLVQNACQALVDKTSALKVTTALDEQNRTIIVEIADEGAGISAEELQHIRDPFFTTRRQSGGTGLGLSISDSIIKKHGGTMRFKSEVGVGTTATIILPIGNREND